MAGRQVRDGDGTYTYPNGDLFSGNWKGGKKHGYGVADYVCGNKYVGEWLNDFKHGQGTFTFAEGSSYTGEWRNDKKHGFGIATFVSGNRFEGEWDEDCMNGQGTFFYASGDVYTGEWKKNRINGVGTWTSANTQDQYEGEWLDGLRHGSGILRRCGEASEIEYAKGNIVQKTPLPSGDPRTAAKPPPVPSPITSQPNPPAAATGLRRPLPPAQGLQPQASDVSDSEKEKKKRKKQKLQRESPGEPSSNQVADEAFLPPLLSRLLPLPTNESPSALSPFGASGSPVKINAVPPLFGGSRLPPLQRESALPGIGRPHEDALAIPGPPLTKKSDPLFSRPMPHAAGFR